MAKLSKHLYQLQFIIFIFGKKETKTDTTKVFYDKVNDNNDRISKSKSKSTMHDFTSTKTGQACLALSV